MIQILQLPLGPMQTNCYLVGCEESGKAVLIDPSWDGRSLAKSVEEQGWELESILLTHTHFDHIGGLAQLLETIPVPVYCHEGAIDEMGQALKRAAFFGLRIIQPPIPEKRLVEGDELIVGEIKMKVLFTPGHAPGHLSFYMAEQKVLFSGDILFNRSIGRTDLPGGDFALLKRMVIEKLWPLPDETKVFSGHGEMTTIGEEKRENPFLQD